MTAQKTYYFSPGPATLPDEVRQQINRELLDTFNIGVSVMEISYRSPYYEALSEETLALCRSVIKVPDTHSVLLTSQGGHHHFSLVLQHLSEKNDTVAYTDTGIWAHLACVEAQRTSRNVKIVYDGAPSYTSLGDPSSWDVPENAKYIHITVNNTVYGTEYEKIPTFGKVPLVLDMTSALLARDDIPWEQTGIIYASAQKNFGIAGVSLVIIRNDLLEKSRYYTKANELGTGFSFPLIYDAKSILNTPPIVAIFCLNRMLKWIENQGGVNEMERQAKAKAELVYSVVDEGFYCGRAEKKFRSRHNFVFTLPKEEMCAHFIAEAAKQKILEIKGFKTVGGIRASMYNGVPLESAKVFADFMKHYRSFF